MGGVRWVDWGRGQSTWLCVADPMDAMDAMDRMDGVGA